MINKVARMGSKWKVIAVATAATVFGGFGLGKLTINMDNTRSNVTFLKSVVALMEEEPKIKELLGEKYQIGSSIQDDFTKQEPNHIQLKLPVTGKNDSAYLYTYARRKTPEEKYKLYKIEMTFSKVEGKKLILLDLGDNIDATYTHEAELGPGDFRRNKAREELMRKMDREFGPLSPSKEWQGRSKKDKLTTSPDATSTAS